MSAEDPGLWKQLVGAAVSAVGMLLGYGRWINMRFDKKADKHSVANEFQRVHNEIGTQRTHIAKIFDQMRESDQRAEERHRELLMQLLKDKS